MIPAQFGPHSAIPLRTTGAGRNRVARVVAGRTGGTWRLIAMAAGRQRRPRSLPWPVRTARNAGSSRPLGETRSVGVVLSSLIPTLLLCNFSESSDFP